MCLLVAATGSNYIASNKYIPEENGPQQGIEAAWMAPISSGTCGRYGVWLAPGCIVAARLSRSCGRSTVANEEGAKVSRQYGD